MARRSVTNPRYQKNTGPAGKTRRSASAAKPKREAGAQAGSTSVKKTAGKKGKRPSLREAFASVPSTPEMRKWRRVWGALIVVALIVAVVIGFAPGLRDNRTALWVGTALYVVTLGGAIYIDLMVIRPLRQKAMAEQKAAAKKDGK